jgi:acid phosphatase (class A)
VAASANYLNGNAVDFAAVLPPAPQDGDARDQADRRIFLETRALQGTPRWQLAADDAQLGNAAMLRHFSCSLEIELAPQQAPRLVALLRQATRDAAQSMAQAKNFYKRPRPFLVNEGPTCVASDTVGNSYDYPSGHTTAGWTWGLVLAQVDPQHAVPILARARAIGDSRVVCGVHNASAVEASRTLTSAVVAAISGSAAFQADLAAARSELAALRSTPHSRPEPQRCAAEAELVKGYW